jgi:predicted flap endonuclease-1-like 5' DNA nuclease
MKIRNNTGDLILIGENYIYPYQVREYPESIAEAAQKQHPDKLTIIGRNPRVEAVREPQAQPVRDDWTEVKGIGPKLADALYFMGITTKAELLRFVAANGESAINDIPGMSDRKVESLISWAQAE